MARVFCYPQAWVDGRESVTKTISSFTLIELLIVVAIIGILAALIIVSLNTVLPKARDARRKSDLDEIQRAFQMYYVSHGNYPDLFTAPGTVDCGAITSAPSGWLSPYMNTIPSDPLWNQNIGSPNLPYDYEYCCIYEPGNSCVANGGQAYAIWAHMETSSGNVGSTDWTSPGNFWPSGYNYVLSNFSK